MLLYTNNIKHKDCFLLICNLFLAVMTDNHLLIEEIIEVVIMQYKKNLEISSKAYLFSIVSFPLIYDKLYFRFSRLVFILQIWIKC